MELWPAILGGLILGPHLVAFKREYSAAETRESTYMRAAFAYVSIEMIKQRPVAGFGFNQFNVANQPFLSDRSTDIRCESIRDYVHHQQLFESDSRSLALVGFYALRTIVDCLVARELRVWRSTSIPPWARGIGLIAICVTSVHLIQMAFHEVSFSSIENGIVYTSFGAVLSRSPAIHRLVCRQRPNDRPRTNQRIVQNQ